MGERQVHNSSEDAQCRKQTKRCRQRFGAAEPVAETEAEGEDEQEIDRLLLVATRYEAAPWFSGMKDVVDNVRMDLHSHVICIVKGRGACVANGNCCGAEDH